MTKRKRAEHDDPEAVQVEPSVTNDGDTWDSAAFRQSVLIDLAFVTLPAIIMVLFRQNVFAAAWFGVGILAIIWQFHEQIRAFWRSLRSDRPE